MTNEDKELLKKLLKVLKKLLIIGLIAWSVYNFGIFFVLTFSAGGKDYWGLEGAAYAAAVVAVCTYLNLKKKG